MGTARLAVCTHLGIGPIKTNADVQVHSLLIALTSCPLVKALCGHSQHGVAQAAEGSHPAIPTRIRSEQQSTIEPRKPGSGAGKPGGIAIRAAAAWLYHHRAQHR